MAKLQDTTLESIIPENLLAFKEIADICKVLKLPVGEVTGSIYYDAIIANFDILPEDVIDLLGWQWHVDFYDSSADLETKRALVKQSLDWHRHKGTQYAVDSILKTVAPAYHSTSWQEYGGDPYYFRIVETGGDKVDYSDKELIAAVNSVKNVRSWLEGIVVDTKQDESNDYVGYLSGKHNTWARMEVVASQGYWRDAASIPLRWNGYHISDDDNDGIPTTHYHKFLGNFVFNGTEWLDDRGNAPKLTASVARPVTAELSGRLMGLKLDGTRKLDRSWKLAAARKMMYWHTASVATVKNGVIISEEEL